MKFKLDPGAYVPEYAHDSDAGMDLRSPRDVHLAAGGSVVIDTGVHVQIPRGYAGLLVSKSGLNVRNGILSTGLIDEGYTGSICVKLYNHGDRGLYINAGDKISQLVIFPVFHAPVEMVNDLEDTERGDNGFGSTGR
jgi:dUTP pyrophosphatase